LIAAIGENMLYKVKIMIPNARKKRFWYQKLAKKRISGFKTTFS